MKNARLLKVYAKNNKEKLKKYSLKLEKLILKSRVSNHKYVKPRKNSPNKSNKLLMKNKNIFR